MSNSRYVQVPADLATITTVGEEGDLAAAGLSAHAQHLIWKSVQEFYQSGTQPGLSIVLRRRGEVVLNRAMGYARGGLPGTGPQVAMQPDTPVCLFSASKAITAMLVHLAAEQGLLSLQDPITRYIPEFGAHGKQHTTIQQMLAHRGGVPRLKGYTDPALLFDHDAVLKLLCAAKPIDPDGRRMAYHAITGGFILGEVVERASGMSLQDYMDQYVRQPLGMKYFRFGVPAEQRADMALNSPTGPKVRFPLSAVAERALGAPWDKVVAVSNTPEFADAVIPAGNVMATADEANRFFQCLLDGGQWQGRQVFKAATVRTAVAEIGPLQLDHTLMLPLRYSAGMMLGAKPVGMFGPDTQHAYGHLGFQNVLCWADPSREISVAILTNGKVLLGKHLVPWFRMLGTISQQCRS